MMCTVTYNQLSSERLLNWRRDPRDSAFTRWSNHEVSPISHAEKQHVWSYAGRVTILTRHLLNAAAKNRFIVAIMGSDFPKKVGLLTTEMRLLSLVGVPFSIGNIRLFFQRILASYQGKDPEGVAMGGLSLSIVLADVFDSVTTFINASLVHFCKSPVALFAKVGLPTAFAISGLGTLSRTIQIAKSLHLFKRIGDVSSSASQNSLQVFLEQTLGLQSSDEIARCKAVLSRTVPEEAIAKLEKLHTQLQAAIDETLSDAHIEKITGSLCKVQAQLIKKMLLDAFGILANLIIITALILFFIGSTSVLPFLLLALGFGIRISVLIYQDHT
ncbi:MAG: hypothetical protein V4492_07945, partial [Chlamydiota bacterium]